jgi:hypothetical protein
MESVIDSVDNTFPYNLGDKGSVIYLFLKIEVSLNTSKL